VKIMKNKYKQSGRSLAEVMIALTIGLAMLAGITSLLVGSKQASRVSDDRSRLDEDGRLALNLLAFHIRMSGYGQLARSTFELRDIGFTNLYDENEKIMEGIEGCSGGFSNPSSVIKVCILGAPATNSDALINRYVVDSNNANLSTGVPTDCLGSAVILSPAVVENRFYLVINPGSGRKELYCQGNGQTAAGDVSFKNAPQPIAENVEDMKITYGFGYDYAQEIDTQVVDRFLTASQVDAMPDPDPKGKGKGTRWSKVISAEICLVMRSANNGVSTKPLTYRDCSGANVVAPDRRFYQRYSTVVTLRNRAAGSLQ
jgi:type IV pilus assembly protein PilW